MVFYDDYFQAGYRKTDLNVQKSIFFKTLFVENNFFDCKYLFFFVIKTFLFKMETLIGFALKMSKNVKLNKNI